MRPSMRIKLSEVSVQLNFIYTYDAGNSESNKMKVNNLFIIDKHNMILRLLQKIWQTTMTDVNIKTICKMLQQIMARDKSESINQQHNIGIEASGQPIPPQS